MANQNDPELQLQGKFLGTITSDFIKISKALHEAAYQLRKRGISQFPIFAMAKDPLKLGAELIPKDEAGLQWHVNFTYVEDLEQRQVLDHETIDEFKEAYKNPDEFACLLVLTPEFMKFVYVPYPDED